MSAYQLPTVWQDEASNQGAFTGLNRPTAGARFEQNLPKGEQAFQLYSLGTPNGVKVTILLEELLEAGFKEAAYDLYKIAIAEQDYLENHVFITSALYGVVPALSPMAPHRLDFLMKLKVAGKTLKSHWKAVYDEALKKEEVIFSLLSSEFETVFSKEIRAKMVTFKFMEDRGGQLKIHSTISKKARGAFLTALIENQVQTVGEARRLNFAGFVYREDLSQPQGLVFVKEV